jgi:hypothetical protein
MCVRGARVLPVQVARCGAASQPPTHDACTCCMAAQRQARCARPGPPRAPTTHLSAVVQLEAVRGELPVAEVAPQQRRLQLRAKRAVRAALHGVCGVCVCVCVRACVCVCVCTNRDAGGAARAGVGPAGRGTPCGAAQRRQHRSRPPRAARRARSLYSVLACSSDSPMCANSSASASRPPGRHVCMRGAT